MRNRLWACALALVLAVSGLHAQTKEMVSLREEAAQAVKKGRVAAADSLYRQYVRLYAAGGYDKNFDYSEVLCWLVNRDVQLGKIDEAIALQQQVAEVRRTATDCTYGQWAVATSDLASLFSRKGNYEKAIELGEEALRMLKEKFGPKHNYYCVALANQASYYAARGYQGDYERAVTMSEEAIKHLKKSSPEYVNAVNQLVVFYIQTGNKAKASLLAQQTLKETTKMAGQASAGGAVVLNNNAIRLANSGNYAGALELMHIAKSYYDSSGQTNSLAYGKILTNMATFCSHLHQYKEAAALLEQAMPVIAKAANQQHPDYLRCVSDLADVYKAMGNLEDAGDLALLSEQISQSMGQQDNVKYGKSLSKQASSFASNGNYQRAIETERKALELFANRGDSVDMAASLDNLANYLFADGQHGQALAEAERALAIFRRRSEPSVVYAQSLNNSAILYYKDQQQKQAMDYGQQALEMYRLLGDTLNAYYARVVANNALFDFVDGRTAQAIAMGQRAVALHRQLLGDTHPYNVPLLYNLAVYLLKDGQGAEASQNYLQALRLQADYVRTNFLHMTSEERENFWTQKSYVFQLAPMLAYLDRDNPEKDAEMLTQAYNAILFTKGILLNSDIDFQQLLKRSGDEQLLKKYNQLAMLRQSEEDYMKREVKQRDAQVVRRMKEQAYRLERELVNGCKEYGAFTENLNITTERIRSVLRDDEVAIEFADVYINGVGTTYLALLLRKGSPVPELVRLFSEQDLASLRYGRQNFWEAMKNIDGINAIYNDPKLGSMVWQPLMERLKGVKTIYFSPTALFYQMGVEYLLCDGQQRIGDRFAVYRLSSTKNLAKRGNKETLKSAVLFGGLNYDMTLDEILMQRKNLASSGIFDEDHSDVALGALAYNAGGQRAIDSLALRGSVMPLDGTRLETFHIAELLLQKEIPTRVLMDNEGIEEAFKALSGKENTIVHIATHGFAFDKKELKQQHQQLLFLGDQNNMADNSLNYSGLLLSGANYVLKGNKLSGDVEDGVLTAREIAQVDLSKTDLVVLSACQTALGEIREDGVFGIQRGFKKAGARSLIMSLWKVDDFATEQMMTTFYRHLTEGDSRHDAFRKAQLELRQKGGANPYYWASFILLDGE